MANAPKELQLFEVNLISDQVSMLLRRRAFQQLSGIAAVLMLAVGTFLAFLIVMHVATAFRMRSGQKIKNKEITELRTICADLDNQRAGAEARMAGVAPLLPIARARMAWAPKLVAAANDLPPGTGIISLQATQRDVFLAGVGSKSSDEGGLPQIAISILYLPVSGDEEENLGLYAERLRNDKTFMYKFDSAHLVAMDRDTWQGSPVEVLHIHALGNPQ